MTAIMTEKDSNNQQKDYLKQGYPWFYANLYLPLLNSIKEFFQTNYEIRFMGISYDENILFYGDEYFVNKISVNKTTDFKIKISSEVIELLLDSVLGESERKFNLKNLTDIEAMLIKSFTVHTYKKIEDKINKNEATKKLIQNKKNLNFTFFVRNKKQHNGKIIITLPEYAIPEITPNKHSETFSITDFKKTNVNLKLRLGSSKIALNEIKSIEDGDIIVLDNSDINTMSVLWNKQEISFRINPNPSLIISIDNNGGNEMEDETSVKSQNMWDSILVDIVAEFDNVKLTLGELKQISEGLVIDVGSVYENKVKLKVENQLVATGELVILNDRYGVRIDSVSRTKETAKQNAETKKEAPAAEAKENKNDKQAPAKPKPKAKPETKNNTDAKEGNENFDYSDFEIEDESI